MGEDSSANGAGPHPETGGELACHLRVASQVLPQAPLIHIELSTHRTRVVCAASLCWVAVKSITADFICRERRGAITYRAPQRHWGPCGQTSCAPSAARRSCRACCRWDSSSGWGLPPGTGAARTSRQLQLVKEMNDSQVKNSVALSLIVQV